MSERSGVQNPILKYAQELGWEYVNRQDAEKYRGFDNSLYLERKDKSRNVSLFFTDILYERVKQFNDKYKDTKEWLIRTLSTLQNNIHGNREFLKYLKGEKTFYSKEENRLDKSVGKYAIIHELLHFRVPNHGKLWKSLMKVYLGEYEKIEKDLNFNDCKLKYSTKMEKEYLGYLEREEFNIYAGGLLFVQGGEKNCLIF